MESDILGQLLQHGLLGVAVVVLSLVVRALYNRNQALSTQKETLHTHYQKQLADAYERNIAKAEEWATNGQEVASKLEGLLSAMLTKGGGE